VTTTEPEEKNAQSEAETSTRISSGSATSYGVAENVKWTVSPLATGALV